MKNEFLSTETTNDERIKELPSTEETKMRRMRYILLQRLGVSGFGRGFLFLPPRHGKARLEQRAAGMNEPRRPLILL